MSKKISKSEYDKIVDLYNNGMSQSQIAIMYNCATTTICNILQKMNVKSRLVGSKNTPDVIQKWIEMYLGGALLEEMMLLKF
jgi:DNA invertase Pin-like site-specific DNA recombinase